MKLFGRRRRGTQQQADLYEQLRKQALHMTAEQLGESFAGAPILAVLMETGYPEGVATLVGVVDGTSSLYFSNGGGVIGAGTHAAVAEANQRWLDFGITYLADLEAVTDPPLPGQGVTQLIAVTPSGLRAAVASEDELGEGRHRLSPFFYAGQDVITEIRLAQGD